MPRKAITGYTCFKAHSYPVMSATGPVGPSKAVPTQQRALPLAARPFAGNSACTTQYAFADFDFHSETRECCVALSKLSLDGLKAAGAQTPAGASRALLGFAEVHACSCLSMSSERLGVQERARPCMCLHLAYARHVPSSTRHMYMVEICHACLCLSRPGLFRASMSMSCGTHQTKSGVPSPCASTRL